MPLTSQAQTPRVVVRDASGAILLDDAIVPTDFIGDVAGTVLTVAGIVLPAGLILIAGMLILLRGVAVTLGVSEPRRPDFYGFGTRPDPGSPGQNRT